MPISAQTCGPRKPCVSATGSDIPGSCAAFDRLSTIGVPPPPQVQVQSYPVVSQQGSYGSVTDGGPGEGPSSTTESHLCHKEKTDIPGPSGHARRRGGTRLSSGR